MIKTLVECEFCGQEKIEGSECRHVDCIKDQCSIMGHRVVKITDCDDWPGKCVCSYESICSRCLTPLEKKVKK